MKERHCRGSRCRFLVLACYDVSMNEKRRRHLWRRKRYIIAAAMWLLLAYPLSMGPAEYAMIRGWTPPGFQAFYVPVRCLPHSRWLSRYSLWWIVLAMRHEGHDVREVADGYLVIRDGRIVAKVTY